MGDDERERAEWLLAPDSGSGGEGGEEDRGNEDKRGPSSLTFTIPSRLSSCRDSWLVAVTNDVELADEGAVCRLGVSGELLL